MEGKDDLFQWGSPLWRHGIRRIKEGRLAGWSKGTGFIALAALSVPAEIVIKGLAVPGWIQSGMKGPPRW